MWTSSVCFLCLKSFDKDTKPRENANYKYRQNLKIKFNTISGRTFVLFCERFLKLPAESPLISILCSKRIETQSSSRASSSSSFLDQFCSECIEILQATFQLYNEICEVQLKLAWKLRQWEALLKEDETSKPSSKLSSLLHQKLSHQLQLNLGIGGTEEVRRMRNLLLTHCNNIRNEMLGHRKLQVALDRCSVPFPFPFATQEDSCNLKDSGPTITFLALDSTSDTPFPNERDVDVVVKREPEDDSLRNHEDNDDDHHHEDFEAMDYKTDFDFSSSNNQKQDSDLKLMSMPPAMADSRLRRSTKNTKFCCFPKKPTPKKVKTPKIKKEVPKTADGIPCEACGKIIPNLKQLQTHHNTHRKRWQRINKGKRLLAPFRCHFCYQTFTNKQHRWVHQEIGGHDKSMTSVKFSCSEEGCTGITPFSTFEDLETHFENVHRSESESVHKCSLCDWPFSSDDMRQVHELVHGNYIRSSHRQNISFKCPRCSQDFQNFPPLQTHFISEHTDLDNVRIHKCPKCSKSYSLPNSLAQHLLTHEMEDDLATGESSGKVYHVCEECGKQCATYNTLQQHKRGAHRTKQCNLCGEIINSRHMSQHMKCVHKVGVKPEDYCRICGKFFPGKSKMKRHMQSIHLGNNVPEGEVCHICSKKYERKGLLHRHLRIAHQIEAEELKRPAKHVCPDCGMGYYYKSSLDNHVDAKHRSSQERKFHFPCALCSKTFWRKCVLIKHLEEAHPQQIQDDTDFTSFVN